MIEMRVQPVIRAMAAFTSYRELGSHVIRIARRLELRSVAGIAGGGHRLKLAVGSALVTGVAIHGCMRSG